MYVTDFDAPSFLPALFKSGSSILDLPYKGRVISELLNSEDFEEVDFRTLLETQICNRTLDLERLPVGTSRNPYGFSGKEARSLMAFNWTSHRHRIGIASRLVHGKSADLGFSKLWKPVGNATSVLKVKKEAVDPEIPSKKSSKKTSKSAEAGSKIKSDASMGSISLMSLTDAISIDLNAHQRYTNSSMVVDELSGIDNVHGTIPTSATSIASVLLKEYGADSPAVAVMLSHLILNDNTAEIQDYIEAGASITLFHFQMLSHLGYGISTQIVDVIKTGGVSFIRDGVGGDEDDENDEELLSVKAS